MPALFSADAFSTTGQFQATNATNVASHGLDVVCAWPVSGQYGPGSRILYYVLISACVLARKAEWIKNACLAAALLLPAVASLHAIVLAAVHQDGAVDLDIYGAFQLCAIGILAAPVTVRLSRTYFYDPGRNTIFIWAGLILAGLLSLTVEFYRAQSVLCTLDGRGTPLSSDPNDFPYDAQPACNMTCTADTGPQSPMRGGAASNKYVIPAPDKLTFGAGTLLCAACCVHAILWLTSMLNKMLEINWKSRFGVKDETYNEPIEGTNGATVGRMYLVNETVRFFLYVAIIPIVGSVGLAVLIVGEINFFSQQMRYQNEPMASIGQWGPIVGTGLAVAGSLYVLLAADIDAAMRGSTGAIDNEHGGMCQHHNEPEPAETRQSSRPPSSQGPRGRDGEIAQAISRQGDCDDGILHSRRNSPSGSDRESDKQRKPAQPRNSGDVGKRPPPKHETSHGEGWSRQRVAAAFVAIGGAWGAAMYDSYDLSKFRDGEALDFPEIPGERERNVNLAHIKEVYSKRLGEDGTPAVLGSRSRANSVSGHGPSGHALDDLGVSREPSARRSASTVPSSSQPRATGLSGPPASPGPDTVSPPSTGADLSRGRQRQRRETLEVPDVSHLRPLREISSSHRESHVLPSTPAVASSTRTEESGNAKPEISL